MKICFYYPFKRYKPKGDILQFLTLLKAMDHKLKSIPIQDKSRFSIDCVLDFPFTNGQDGFFFHHVKFYHAENYIDRIKGLERKQNYDFIFVRGKKEALDLLKENRKIKKKLLVLCIHYNVNDEQSMKEMFHLFKNVRILFFQSAPWAERFKTYALQKGIAQETFERRVKVLPQYIDASPEQDATQVIHTVPLQIVQAGVLRPRYAFPIAVQATQLIQAHDPHVFLHVVYPSVEDGYLQTAQSLLSSPVVKDYGMLSYWDTKKLILTAGIGLALVFDDTENKNPTYSYQTRILEYSSLGVPVITTKTEANIHLFGENYPLFVDNIQDIFQCYKKLTVPHFYREISQLVKAIGDRFVYHKAVGDFWSLLLEEYND